jgi:hypothetical protein
MVRSMHSRPSGARQGCLPRGTCDFLIAVPVKLLNGATVERC